MPSDTPSRQTKSYAPPDSQPLPALQTRAAPSPAAWKYRDYCSSPRPSAAPGTHGRGAWGGPRRVLGGGSSRSA
ncbi:hypothetical protein K438DRAFT_444037 [Mycena galopus ATCC 62051]|nr:hypothetical protein K438DRAFT_444037 [Mycena galopus ATCC 62051]